MSHETRGTMRAALAWLAHPVSVVALAVLVLNDHVLKQAYGTWWTGKLSDVAGLVFFPALVAVTIAGIGSVTGLAVSRPDLAAVAVAGLGFVWVKATVVGAAVASAVLSGLAGPSVIRADVTDLLALPALGLAAWAAGASTSSLKRAGDEHLARRSDGSKRLRRAFGVALVPVALLASVATGPGPRPEASVVDTGADGWVVVTRGCGGGECSSDFAYRLSDYGWLRADLPGGGAHPVNLACSTVEPETCFRTVPDRLAVEQSSDGGDTWKKAWAASSEDMRALRDAYAQLLTDQEDHLVSSGVGVFDGADGMTVVVGNQVDGLLVRGPDGDWERVAFRPLSCCEGWGYVPLPTRWMPYGSSVPPAVGWALAAIVVTGTASLLTARRRLRQAAGAQVTSRERGAWWLTAAVAVAAATFGVATGPLVSTAESIYEPVLLASALSVAAGLVCVILGLGAISAADAWSRRLWWRLSLIALAIAVAVGAMVFAVPGAGWWDLAVASVVGVAGVWVGARVIEDRAKAWRITPLVDPPTQAQIEGVLAEARAADEAEAPPTEVQGTRQWTANDAVVLRCVGRGWDSVELWWLLDTAGRLGVTYPTRRQLEASLGALEASGLVKTVRPGWFAATRTGRGVLRRGRSLRGWRRVLDATDALLGALHDVECIGGRVPLTQDAYDRALQRHLS